MKKQFITMFLILAVFFTMSAESMNVPQFRQTNTKTLKNDLSREQLNNLRPVERKANVRPITLNNAPAQQRVDAAVAADFTLPYYQNFESSDRDLANLGYTQTGNIGEAFEVGTLADQNSNRIPGASGYTYLVVSQPNNAVVASNQWLFSSEVSLTAGTEYCFEMYVFAPEFTKGIPESFKLAIGESKAEANMKIVADRTGQNAVASASWVRVRAFYTPTATKAHYFGINYCTPAGGRLMAIDDIRFYEVKANDANVEFYSYPMHNYTLVPEFLKQYVKDTVYVAVENTGKNSMSNPSLTVNVKKNGTEDFTNVSYFSGSLPNDMPSFLLGTSEPYTVAAPTSQTAKDSYEISATITSTEGLDKTITTTFEGGLLTDDILGYDNGEVGRDYYPIAGKDAYCGAIFYFHVRTKIKSLSFVGVALKENTGATVGIYEFTTDGTGLNLIGTSLPIVSGALKEAQEYAVGVLESKQGGDLIVNPGAYFVSIMQPKDDSFAVMPATNYNPAGAGIYYVPATKEFDYLPVTLSLRTIVESAPTGIFTPNITDGISVYSDNNTFELNYTSDYTSAVIYNLSGQAVAAYDLPENGKLSVLTTNLLKGTYLIRFAGKKAGTVKIVK